MTYVWGVRATRHLTPEQVDHALDDLGVGGDDRAEAVGRIVGGLLELMGIRVS